MESHNPNHPYNGLGSQQERPDPRSAISRPFTLQEALPYSPQTSTVPFIPDIIPDPTIGSGSPAPPVASLFTRHEFDRLNEEAGNQDQLPKTVKHAVEYVLQDLIPTRKTQYTFRTLQTTTPSPVTGKSLTQGLSPVTKAVYGRVGSFFKATKPNSNTPTPMNGRAQTPIKPSIESAPSVSPSISAFDPEARNQQAHRSNSVRIEVAIPAKSIERSSYVDITDATSSTQPLPPQPLAPQHHQQQQASPIVTDQSAHQYLAVAQEAVKPEIARAPSFRVELPSAGINRDEYLEVNHTLDSLDKLSTRKAEDQSYAENQDLLGQSLDQRQRSEAALDALDKLMRHVFAAVGCVLGGDAGYEHIVSTTSNQDVVMTAATQQKMHSSIQKVIGLGCFDRAPLENLVQVLKLSEVTLRQVEELELRVDEEWDEAAVESWIGQLSEVETMLKAARTSLRVLSGGREDKQLYSEFLIETSVKLFKQVIDDLVIPLVEMRNSGSSANIFKMFAKHKKELSSTFSCCQKVFSLLAELVTKIELSESVINTLEFTASKLIFVENAYFEKDSAVGVQKFDGIRSVAMDMLCQIFIIRPEQRQGIIDDILTSLEKLPVGKQSSRQFKLSDGGSIQPVSALIMRLVQASSGRVEESSRHGVSIVDGLNDEEASGDDETTTKPSKKSQATSVITSERLGAQQHSVAIHDLEAVVAPLSETARRNASYVINFIVTRAVRSTKSGDTPYRNLLDLFVDDFTTCLDSPDWPSAELLLRLLMLMMMQLFEAGKTPAPAKNMALELLGTMSAAISRLRSHVKKTAATFEGSDADELSRYLSDLAALVLDQKSSVEHIVAWSGPFRIATEYLQGRSSDDPHLSNAISFLVADWATRVHTGYDFFQDDEPERDEELGRLGFRLRMMIENRSWLANEWTFKPVSGTQAKFAYSVILLKSPLCESFGKILNTLLGSMASDQATVRSKSLKSINQVLETDPSILDGNSPVIQLILDCSSDSSTQVRDSALGLLGSCISMRPGLEASLTRQIIDRFHDAGVGVRKRAMKLARDIYLRNRDKSLRSAIANGLLRRVQDPDESVRDLARQMMEEVWFAPFYHKEATAVFETALSDHVALIIQTVKSGNVTEILDKVFQTILKPQNKALEGPFSVCSKVVANMFGLLDNLDSDDPTVPSGRDALQVLTIFAKADPKLFNFEQIRLLKPQLASFNGTDELAAFRAVNVIYKRVLPSLPTVHSEFLVEVRLQLLKGIGKISSRGALDDLIACTRACCDLLKDFAPLANLVASSLLGVQKLPKANLNPRQLSVLGAYAIILGYVAKHCDLDKQIQTFKARFPKWTGESVPRLIIDTLSPYASASQPMEARKASLEAIGLVCQAWPRNYVLAKVYTAFQQVFQDEVPVLETMILRSFKEFLMTEEKRSEAASAAGGAADLGKKKELTVMGGTNFDDVASATTQRFLKDFTRIALATQDEHAFLAMEVLGSINRQGLTHPKETGTTLITLETSANRKIADLAFMEHKALHDKHETVLEREYAKAIQSAYNYQRDVVGDSHGAISETFQPKLHLLMEVLKISKMKNRQRFLEKLCAQVDFDPASLDATEIMPQHVDFSRFILENIAFFDYQTVGELQTVVNTMEKIVTSTGATVAQTIESEIFNVRVDADQQLQAQIHAQAQADAGGTAAPSDETVAALLSVDTTRLRQLTAACMVLLIMWEARTYLRRLYGMGTSRHDSKAKALAKDLNKSPVKVQGITGSKFWDEVESHMKGLGSQELMVQKCKAFVELMNVDKEFKVADEDEDMGLEDAATPSDGEADDGGMDRGRKRKGMGTPGGRKKRARSNSQPRKRGRPRKQQQEIEEDMDDDLDGDWI